MGLFSGGQKNVVGTVASWKTTTLVYKNIIKHKWKIILSDI